MEAVENMDHYSAKDNDNDKTEEELSESGGTTSSTTESDVSDVEVDSNDEDPFAWDKQVCHLFRVLNNYCEMFSLRNQGNQVASQCRCLFPIILLACSTLLHRCGDLPVIIQPQIKQSRFWVLARNIVMCSWAKHILHYLSPPKCILAN